LLPPLGNARDNGLFVRKLSGFELRVNQFAIQRDLEAATAGRDERELLDFLFEVVEQFGRQTDGLRFVSSDRAVFQLDVHGDTPGDWSREF
jgi:hypothetical protein